MKLGCEYQSNSSPRDGLNHFSDSRAIITCNYPTVFHKPLALYALNRWVGEPVQQQESWGTLLLIRFISNACIELLVNVTDVLIRSHLTERQIT